MSKERREQERFFLGLQAKLTFRHHTEAAPVMTVVAANISAGGAFLQTDHDIALAAKVQVEFLINLDDLRRLKFILPADKLRKLDSRDFWIKTTGIVLRKESDGIGVIFTKDYQLSSLEH